MDLFDDSVPLRETTADACRVAPSSVRVPHGSNSVSEHQLALLAPADSGVGTRVFTYASSQLLDVADVLAADAVREQLSVRSVLLPRVFRMCLRCTNPCNARRLASELGKSVVRCYPPIAERVRADQGTVTAELETHVLTNRDATYLVMPHVFVSREKACIIAAAVFAYLGCAFDLDQRTQPWGLTHTFLSAWMSSSCAVQGASTA
mmetsp:Transcript_2280/g.5430  ORF Transcript_2280/g.5430 Transcript_2280/m.5430 type:complete len:206 (+) Transcript_2280:173-790(+)